jgi:hypothetical protein
VSELAALVFIFVGFVLSSPARRQTVAPVSHPTSA